MKLLQRQPGAMLRCSCLKEFRPDCDVHRARALIEFTWNPPRWVWHVWYRYFSADTRRWLRR